MKDKFIVKMYEDGVSLEQISKAMRVSTHDIINIVWENKCKN